MPVSQPYGYWTFGKVNGLYGAESTFVTQLDGSIHLVKDPDYPAVLEDDYILWAVKNDTVALTSFHQMLPTMDAVSQHRLNGLVEKYPAHFIYRLDTLSLSDNIQYNGVTQTRGDTCRNPYLETPKPHCTSRKKSRPETYSSDPVTVDGGDSVSIPIPTSLEYMTKVTNLPGGLVWNGNVIRGTAPTVSSDESFQVTVARENSIGSSIGYLTLTVTT